MMKENGNSKWTCFRADPGFFANSRFSFLVHPISRWNRVGVGRFCLPVLKPEFIQLVAQSPQADPEGLRCTGSVPSHVLQGSGYQLPFHFAHCDAGGNSGLDRFSGWM